MEEGESFPGHHQRPNALIRNKHLILKGDLERACTTGAFNISLRMPRPTKRHDSIAHHFAWRVPTDVLARVRGMRLTVPVGDVSVAEAISVKDVDIRVSLRRRDPQEAKAREAFVLAYLEVVWRAVREGPQSLTHKEAVALAGAACRTPSAPGEDDPGPVAGWAVREMQNLQAEFGGFGRAPVKNG